MSKAFHALCVEAIHRETRDAVAIRFTVPPELAQEYGFRPGQYLTLRTFLEGEEVRRSYSICTGPGESGLTVAVKRVPGGRFSTWANEVLRVGDRVDVLPPDGRFVRVPPAASGNYLAIVAGSGITPVLSILKAVLQDEPQARFTLVYGNRAAHAVMFREQLEDLKNLHMTRFSLVHVLSRERQEMDVFNGRIDETKCRALFDGWVDIAAVDAAYLCGPQSMMEGAAAALHASGVPAERIRRELFHTDGASPAAKASQAGRAVEGECQVTVVQDGRERRFNMPRGGPSLLRAALEQGVELPWSCQGGVCSTCRCKVVEGEVEMDTNFALEDYEIASGFRLACQSYPLSDRLVIDYDQHT